MKLTLGKDRLICSFVSFANVLASTMCILLVAQLDHTSLKRFNCYVDFFEMTGKFSL